MAEGKDKWSQRIDKYSERNDKRSQRTDKCSLRIDTYSQPIDKYSQRTDKFSQRTRTDKRSLAHKNPDFEIQCKACNNKKKVDSTVSSIIKEGKRRPGTYLLNRGRCYCGVCGKVKGVVT